MKKVILTVMVAMFAAGAFAQTTTPKTDSKKDMKDLRQDTRDVRHDKRLRAHDVKNGNNVAAKAETKDIKADKKEMAGHVKDLKKDGVKHPVKRAHAQIHKQNVRHHS
jgi:Ni/Co efflux regulator RcnB